MIILPSDFKYEKYGIAVRLVTEGDAEYILSLRTNAKLSKYIHTTDADINKQIQWIHNYKIREKEGVDYYFMYVHNGVNIGVSRIYDIDDSKSRGTSGSWICSEDAPMEYKVATLIIGREILFEVLNLKFDFFDVRKGNVKVQRLHKMFGAEVIDEDDLIYYFRLTKELFEKKKDSVLDLLNIQ